MALDNGSYLMHLHPKPQIRFVASEIVHCLIVGNSLKRLVELNTLDILEKMLYKPFKHLEDIFSLHKTHLTVYLGEFRLAVSSQILISEASYYLAIAVKSGHHQELLESLRTLRKSIEFTRIHP